MLKILLCASLILLILLTVLNIWSLDTHQDDRHAAFLSGIDDVPTGTAGDAPDHRANP